MYICDDVGNGVLDYGAGLGTEMTCDDLAECQVFDHICICICVAMSVRCIMRW